MRGVWLLAALLCGCACAAGAAPKSAEMVRVTPRDTGEALVNPDMGWMLMYYSNLVTMYGSQLEPADTVDDFPGLSTVYLRVPWAFIEPEEGRFNWPLLDTPAQRWIARGKRIALRITSSENWMKYATPEWVIKAGAKGCFYEYGKGRKADGPSWDPDFGDPVFLAKLDNMLAKLAERYDGNPNVAYIDVGSYGLWGEGHTLASSQVPEEAALPIIKRHIDLYQKHFKKTLLAANDDLGGSNLRVAHTPETDYALERGLTLRDDSILVQPPPNQWFHAEMAQPFWPLRPVILEHEHYGPSKERGAWGNGSRLLQAVEEYHASYLTIHGWPRDILKENRAVIDAINRRIGYRLDLQEISWPSEVAAGQAFAVHSRWGNAGVAPCYPGGYMALTLKDANSGIVSVLVDEGWSVRDLPTGPAGNVPARDHESRFTAGLIAPVTRPGTYDLYVSVGRRDGTPVIALPLERGDGQRRYLLGHITLTSQP